MKKEITTIVQSNDLVDASYSLSLDEMRLLNLALTKIDSRSKNPGQIPLNPKDFSEMYGLSEHNIWRNMKNAIHAIEHKPVVIYKEDDKGKLRRHTMSWLAESIHHVDEKDGSQILIEFSHKITPYLFELQSRFTQIEFECASQLNTPFSYRLYQWLIKKKYVDQDNVGYAISVELEIDWMKKASGIGDGYDRWDNFKARVIDPAVDQINSKTDISVIWKPIKKGRAVHSIEFSYMRETGSLAKPIRPRLYRRPKVVADSHAEGEWMQKNLKLLMDYKADLHQYDPDLKIDMADLRKMELYSKKLGDVFRSKEFKKEISERTGPKEPNKKEPKVNTVISKKAQDKSPKKASQPFKAADMMKG